MINVEILNETLCGDFDAIITILEALQLTDIYTNKSRREIRCSRDEGRNPSSIRIQVDTLYYRCFSTGDKGSLYTLVMSRLKKNFPESLKWVAELLGLEPSNIKRKSIILPFKGFFKKIMKQTKQPELYLKKYDEAILQEYAGKYSLLFNQDGIGYDVQNFFKVGYDFYSNRITIPQWDVNGNLVGIMGRLNDSEASKQSRWIPIIPCQRSLTLFGYHFNYADIQQKQFCLVGESEKFVMQTRSMGLYCTLATCGCDISTMQARYIKALMCKVIILCYDEGLTENKLIKQAKKLQVNTPLYRNKVGFIFDPSGKFLKKGSKNSPSDLGIKVLRNLLKSNIRWI